MKIFLVILLSIWFPTMSLAQDFLDTLQQRIYVGKGNVGMDSVAQKVLSRPDTRLIFHKTDSARNAFNLEADSIKSQYQRAVSKIEAKTSKLNYSLDSAQRINLPTGRYTKKIDSLQRLRQDTEAKFTSKLDALKSKTTGKLNSLDLPPEYKEPLKKFTENIDVLNLNSDVLQIPSLDIPGYSLPKLDGITDITSKAGQLGGDVGDFGTIGALDNLPNMDNVGDLGAVTEQAQGYQDEIKNLTQGNLDDVEAIPQAIEQQATKLDGVEELQKQSGVVDGYKRQLEDFNDAEAVKRKAMEMAKETAIDHFAGKQEQLKAAMDKISKYKQKYSSVSSLKDLPKRPPNAMKGKPFIERLVPGLYFQYQQKAFFLIDVNPYLGYKISGIFTAGLGWNHRYAYDKKRHKWDERARIFGPRGYVDFKLGKGFIAHLEAESMNSFVPSTIWGNPDTGHREWVWSFMTGIKKEYKIYRNLKGTALLQYNLFNPYYKAPYVDRLNSRIGFEYVLRKSRKKK